MHIDVLSTEELGDRSYVVHDGEVAIVIDPQRDIDRIQELLDAAGVRLELVLETHVHNDYVTGGYQLALTLGAKYGINAADAVAFDRLPLQNEDVLEVGMLRLEVLSTPGHTFTHLAFIVTDLGASTPPCVFTGGSLLFGSVGRTDLVDAASTDRLTRAQYQSAHRLAEMLPDETRVYPTHGFGSFCSAGATTSAWDSTMGAERFQNDALTATDEDSFVKTLTANLNAYPAYYAHMAQRNLLGPDPVDLSAPDHVDPVELAHRLAAGECVVDLRDQVMYAARHLEGSVNVPLGPKFATYIGWVVPWGSPITLIADTPGQIPTAQRQLTRIGIDRLAGAATGGLDGLISTGQRPRTYPRVSFAELDGWSPGEDTVVDVRRQEEHDADHLPGSKNIPLHEITDRLHDLPDGRLWIHCASGYRAAIAASLLDRAGREVVLIDDVYPGLPWRPAPAAITTAGLKGRTE